MYKKCSCKNFTKIKSNLKVFHLITSVQLGGAEVVAFNIIKGISNSNIEFILLELYASNTAYANQKKNELRKNGIKVVTLCNYKKRSSLLLAPLKLYSIMRNDRYSIFHSHTDLPDFVLSVSLRISKIFKFSGFNIMRTIHNTVLWPNHKRIAKFVESSFENDHVVGVSKGALKAYTRFRKKMKLRVSEKITLIFNGCKLPTNKILELKLDNSRINIGICGRFEYQKGIDLLITFLNDFNDQIKNRINFIFIGSGSYKQELQILSQKNENISLHKPINKINNKLHSFDYILMPSRFDGLSLMSIEASFAKVPVIASNVKGLKETLPSDWPLFFDVFNNESLLLILKGILNNKFDPNVLSEISHEFVNKHFTIDKMCKKYEQLYLSYEI